MYWLGPYQLQEKSTGMMRGDLPRLSFRGYDNSLTVLMQGGLAFQIRHNLAISFLIVKRHSFSL